MREVIQGEQETFTINLTQTKTLSDGTKVVSPFDLTSNTEIEVCFKVSTIKVTKLKTLTEVSVIGADTDGKIQASLEVADSDSFQAGNGDIEIVVTKPAGAVTKFQILNGFQVVTKIC